MINDKKGEAQERSPLFYGGLVETWHAARLPVRMVVPHSPRALKYCAALHHLCAPPLGPASGCGVTA